MDLNASADTAAATVAETAEQTKHIFIIFLRARAATKLSLTQSYCS